jgi:tripartite-type tricarboxylate transporter receptor subunit TctC
MRSVYLAALALFSVVCAMPHAAIAQDFPNRTIRIIVPFSAGGNYDVFPRIVARRASEILGQSIVIENRTGASGRIAIAAVKRADPDGYTLFATNAGTHASNPAVLPNLGYDPINDLAPVAYFAESSMGVMVNAGLPVKSLSDVLKVLRSEPGKWNYGSAGIGSQQQLGSVMFLSAMGLPQSAMVHVPYAGVSPAIKELVAGRIQFLITSFGLTIPFIESGNIRPIASMSDTRRAKLPNVPTMPELGYPDLKLSTWVGLSAPAGTPEPVLDRLHDAVNQALNDPGVQQQLATMDYTATPMSRKAFGERIKSEVALYKKIVADGGLVFAK